VERTHTALRRLRHAQVSSQRLRAAGIGASRLVLSHLCRGLRLAEGRPLPHPPAFAQRQHIAPACALISSGAFITALPDQPAGGCVAAMLTFIISSPHSAQRVTMPHGGALAPVVF
jgi:hypothetical protein